MEQILADVAHLIFLGTSVFFAVVGTIAAVWLIVRLLWSFIQSVKLNAEDYPVFTLLTVLFTLFVVSGLIDAVYRGS